MKEYDEITLKKIQSVEMGILKDFTGICQEFHLTYFGFAGTAIGALRHKGFIPWDDDIDVGLPRKDYEKLLKVFEERFAEKYTIGNAEHFINYPLMTTRIMLKGTKFIEESFKNLNCDLGIFLDVYAFDNIPNEDKKYKRQALLAWFWSKILILRQIRYPVLPLSGIKKKAVHIACTFVHFILKAFRVSPKWIYRKCKKNCCRYNNAKTDRMAFMCGTNPFRNIINKKQAFPVMALDFEDIKMEFPRNVDEILREFYGDYMQLPPVQKRKNHYPYCLDFGDKQ